jgi:hypothetical protein
MCILQYNKIVDQNPSYQSFITSKKLSIVLFRRSVNRVSNHAQAVIIQSFDLCIEMLKTN